MLFDFDIHITTVFAGVAGFINLLIGALLMFAREKTSVSDRLFGLIAFSIALWALSRVLFEVAHDPYFVQLWAVLLYMAASLIPMFFFFFTLSFGKEKVEISKTGKIFAILSYLGIIVAVLVPGFIFTDIVTRDNIRVIILGDGYWVYSLYIVGYFTAGFIILISKYIRATGIQRIHLGYVFLGTFLASIVGVFTNLVLPIFGNFQAFWFGPVATMIMVVFVSYAIIKHRLFDVRVVTAEFFAFTLWFFILMRLLFAESTQARLLDGALLLIAVILGSLLIRSAVKEIAARERIERLAEDLAEANERLRELDQQKSEFVSIASHQLRSPLTAIKGYASMMLEGSFGRMSKKIHEPVDRILKSSGQLMSVVEDLLNMTRIEQGRMKYDLQEVDINKLVSEIIEDLGSSIEQSGLHVELMAPKSGNYVVEADKGKIRQVFLNLIDNAIKYTTKGHVHISLSENSDTGALRISIDDTGIGLSPDLDGHLFEKFNRGDNSTKMHANGSGIGLYLAHEVVVAHGGKIWAESPGEDKGTTFFVELPRKNK